MREVQADPVREELKKPLYIGRTGDNETMQVFFPVREWLDEYAGCEVHLSYGRPTEADQREVTAVELVGDDLVWTVEDIDVEKAGTGVATVYMLRGEQVEKSAEYSVIVKKARPIGPTPTDAVKEWFLQILAAKGKGPRINAATGTWEVWDVDAQEWVDTEVHAEGTSPRIEVEDVEGGHRVTVYDAEHPDGQSFDVMDGEEGDPGDDGVSPEVTIQSITGGHRVTITDAEHPDGQSFDVLDGEEGDPGNDGVSPEVTIQSITGGHRVTITDAAHPDGQNFDVLDGEDAEVPIDDTEPAANKVYSSAKVEQVVGLVNQAIAEQAKANEEQARVLENLKIAATGKLFNYVDDTTESYRKSLPVGVLPNGLMTKIGGRSIVWNQQANTITSSTINGITFTVNADGSITANGTATADVYKILGGDDFSKGHKMLILGCPSGGSVDTYYIGLIGYTDERDTGNGRISSNTIPANKLTIIIKNGTTVSNLVFKPQCFDLTQMGIADIITTVDDFRAMFPADWYNYSEPTLMSAPVTDVKQIGSNVLDPDAVGNAFVSKGGTYTGGIASISAASASGMVIPVEAKQNTQYTLFLFGHNTGAGGTTNLRFRYTDGTTSTILSWGATSSTDTYLVTRSAAGKTVECILGANGGGTTNLVVAKCGLMEGNITESSFKPYTLIHHLVPSAVQALEGYGIEGNYISYDASTEKWSFTQNRAERAYQSGDEDDTTLITDGTNTVYPLEESVVTDITEYMAGFEVLTGLEAGGTLTFVNSNGDDYRIPVPSVESYEVSVQEVLSNG